MFGFTAKTEQRVDAVSKAADRSIYKNIRQAAFSIRKYIRNSIVKSAEPAAPGQPVATRARRGNVKNSIFVAADDDMAIIGPRHSFVGDAMQVHEFGGKRGEQRYKPRPTSGPGLEANTDRFAGAFRGSIGE